MDFKILFLLVIYRVRQALKGQEEVLVVDQLSVLQVHLGLKENREFQVRKAQLVSTNTRMVYHIRRIKVFKINEKVLVSIQFSKVRGVNEAKKVNMA